ncbi:MAG TPA: flagellar filament capping protein FliD [Oscillospiraceae bacterium]|nr:flagellar filament capping protein FliD [Oscillospiraceae bacterium]
MANTSSSTTAASSLFSGLRSSGLMSGLDTETIVKQMAAATKNRITKQQQKLDKLSWKQSSYRDVISKMSTFKDTYLNSLKQDTNIKSNYLMAASTATSSNSKITATASSSANAATYAISNIQQLAEKAKIEGTYTSSLTNGIALDFSGTSVGSSYSLNVTLDGRSSDITFSAGVTKADTIDNFNAALKSKFNDGAATPAALIGADANGTLKYAISDSVSHSYSVQAAKTAFTGTAAEIIQKQQASLDAVGLSEGASNKVSLSSKLKDINFATPLNGGSFSFEVNGKSFTFTGDSSIKEIINTVNADTDAKATITFDSLAQKFTISSDEEGTASALEIKQTSGNLLNSMFGNIGIKDGGIGSLSLKSSGVSGAAIVSSNFNDYKNSQFEVTVNGVKKTIGLWGYDTNGEKNDFNDTKDSSGKVTELGTEKVVKALNTELTKSFGTNAPQFKYDSVNKSVSLTTSNFSDTVSINSITGNAQSSVLVSRLGYSTIASNTNELTADSKISSIFGGATGSFSVGGTTFDITADTTLGQLKSALEAANAGTVDYKTGVISVNSAVTADTEQNKAFVSSLFNESYDTLNSYAPSAGSESLTKNGTNAVLTINGTTITNATNSISVDGTTINIANLKADDISKINGGESATIGTKRDTTKAFDAVVKFVDDYNKLITDLNTELSTKRPKSNNSYYEPLTDEQKEEMTEKQIENWEEKAKTGLLYADSTISATLTKVRSALNVRTADNFSLYDMGITVSSNYKDNGKLIIDESKLRAAFDSNPDKIQELFTDSEKGLGVTLEKAIDSAISTKRDNLGSLTSLAGIANTSTQSENTISKQIDTFNTVIAKLKESYQDEIERYWSKFTTLETMMAKYNSQSSLFSQS